ncbi:MAG: hypothetical protein IPL14_18795 [Nitrospira sp.]|nr:hypothetical protein [Nitrospira sp.]
MGVEGSLQVHVAQIHIGMNGQKGRRVEKVFHRLQATSGSSIDGLCPPEHGHAAGTTGSTHEFPNIRVLLTRHNRYLADTLLLESQQQVVDQELVSDWKRQHCSDPWSTFHDHGFHAMALVIKRNTPDPTSRDKTLQNDEEAANQTIRHTPFTAGSGTDTPLNT